MSIAISDILKLPCLREARVVAGHAGLSRPVSSVSVLEYVEPSMLQECIYRSMDFNGGELVISGFINIREDVEAQCINIRRLAQVGEVGLVLYYVGIFLPSIDPRLIQTADELDFPLICMPENRMNLRYSEVICEVMEAIFKDQQQSITLVTDILERVSLLPEHQRSVDSVLKMLSDRIRTSVLLTDSAHRALGLAAWPRTLQGELEGLLPSLPAEGDVLPLAGGTVRVSRCSLSVQGAPMELILLKAGDPLSGEAVRQSVELVQLTVNIWSRHHAEPVITELVRAILKDEPLKMRRLAEIFHIDVASIHTMWVLRGNDTEQRDRFIQMLPALVRDLLAPHCQTLVMDFYEDDLVLFFDNSACQDHATLADTLAQMLQEHGLNATLTVCNNLATTADVRQAFLANRQQQTSLCVVWPRRPWYTLQDILFTQHCRSVLELGEAAVEERMRRLFPLRPVDESGDGAQLRETIEVLLLDAEGSVTRTAELLCLHKNTVKYRVQRIQERLGYAVSKMPERFALYEACVLRRLMT